MIDSKVYFSKDITFVISEANYREEPRKLLMSTPEYFDVIDVKNIHMKEQAGKVNTSLAQKQWDVLKEVYTSLKIQGLLEDIYLIPGAASCEDMVFCANQSFPWMMPNGEKVVIMSQMFHESRKREVIHFEKFYRSLNYRICHLQKTNYFEGMGDTIPHPFKRLLYGGYGHRTNKDAYNEIAETLNVPVVALELKDSRFYHLDTCFVPLGEETVMICEEAFTHEGLKCLQKLFKKIITIPVDEAVNFFSLNAHVIFNSKSLKAAVLQKGSTYTTQHLKNEGFNVIEVDTGEFMKSGGSVFCMKMMLY